MNIVCTGAMTRNKKKPAKDGNSPSMVRHDAFGETHRESELSDMVFIVWSSQFPNPDFSKKLAREWDKSERDWTKKFSECVVTAVQSGDLETLARIYFAVEQIHKDVYSDHSVLQPDDRKSAILIQYLSGRPEGSVTTRELIAFLKQNGFDDYDPQHRKNKKVIKRVRKEFKHDKAASVRKPAAKLAKPSKSRP